MITENLVLYSDFKKKLKHLSIDNEIYVSVMLTNGAKYVLSNNLGIKKANFDDYEPFTMKIDEELKKDIKSFCKMNNVKIKDFWNTVASITIKKEGEFN